MTLTEFLLACIAEDEEAAMAALGEPAYGHFGETAFEEVLEMAENEGASSRADEHFLRHDPARVLAECEARRLIVTELSEFLARCYELGAEEETPTTLYGIERQLRHLASVYADHPDYDEGWRP